MSQQRFAVIGSGAAGLQVAAQLKQAGQPKFARQGFVGRWLDEV